MEEERIYHSLADMRRRKNRLRIELAANEKIVGHLWKNLFHKGGSRRSSAPSRRLSRIVSTGAGVLDGVILAWKLYRRFKS